MSELEALLVDLTLQGSDAALVSFASTLDALSAKTGGRIEFEVRVDGDAWVQRLASVIFDEDRRILLALSADGLSILQIPLADEVDGDFFTPLSTWHGLPLREKPNVNTDPAATLLLGALRSRGLLSLAHPRAG